MKRQLAAVSRLSNADVTDGLVSGARGTAGNKKGKMQRGQHWHNYGSYRRSFGIRVDRQPEGDVLLITTMMCERRR